MDWLQLLGRLAELFLQCVFWAWIIWCLAITATVGIDALEGWLRRRAKRNWRRSLVGKWWWEDAPRMPRRQ
jgi:hypothetical protein